jgi:ribonuclease BN (tRNA processing enzyme)
MLSCIPHVPAPDFVHLVQSPEIAFTGDTTIDFIKDPRCQDALRARVLIMECTFLDDKVDIDGAKTLGHMHVRDIAEHADQFKVSNLHRHAKSTPASQRASLAAHALAADSCDLCS